MNSTLLRYQSITADPEGPGKELSGSNTSLGLGGNGYGFGIGGGLSEGFVFGGRIGFASSETSVEGFDSSASGVFIYGEPEIVFGGPEDGVRPFLGALVGYETLKGESSSVETEESAAIFGPTVGLHAFLNDFISLDPSATLFAASGGIKVGDADVDTSGTGLLISVALSGWLGGGGDGGVPSSSEPEEATGESVAPAEAASAPPPAKVETGEHRATVLLGEGSRLLVVVTDGVPEADVTVVVGDTPETRSCTTLNLITDKGNAELGPFAPTRVTGGFGSMIALKARLSSADLDTLALSVGSVTIEGCGKSFGLDLRDRQELRGLANRLRKASGGSEGKAPRQGEPGAEEPAPPADPAP